jgi:subtilisin family serine protease
MRVLNVLLLVLFASSASARVGSVERVLEAVDGVIPDEYVVVLDEGVEPRGLVNALKNSGKAEILHTYKIVNGFAVRMNLNALENALKNQDGVTIYPNDVATAISVQSPVGSWGIDRVDQTTGTNNQYSYLRDGTDVDVYILDTGIKTDHPDFGGRASHGYDATGEGNFDGNGHGTHVAGTSY